MHAYKITHKKNEGTRSSRYATGRAQKNTSEECSAQVEARLMASRDGGARIARIEALKNQIDTGNYCVDSATIAQRLLDSPLARKSLGIE